MDQLMQDTTAIRNIPGNQALIPTFQMFSVLKEGYYDLLKKNRIVQKVENLTETHITNKKSFMLFKNDIIQNYTKLDKDFANLVIFRLKLDRKLKSNTFYWVMSKSENLTLDKITDVLLSISENRKFEDVFYCQNSDYDLVDFEKRFDTNVVFHVGKNPEELANNMKVLKYWGEVQKSETFGKKNGQHLSGNFGDKNGLKRKKSGFEGDNNGQNEEKLHDLIKTYRSTAEYLENQIESGQSLDKNSQNGVKKQLQNIQY